MIDHTAKRVLLIVGVASLVLTAFSVSVSSMWDLWQTVDHRHGLLVFPISAFLLWSMRARLSAVSKQTNILGLLAITLLSVLWLIARLAGIQVVEHMAVLAMIPAAIATVLGFPLVRAAMFPLFFLIMATPIGESFVPFLMEITADLSAFLLRMSDIPLLRNGQYMSLPGGEFVVADVCSGLRYLLTGGMISLLFGYLTFTRLQKRLVFVAVTIATLIVANGVRAYVVMAIASASNMQYMGGRDHIYFGWLLFGLVMMALMWVGARYADEQENASSHKSSQADTESGASPLPLVGALVLLMLASTVKQLEVDVGEHGVSIILVASVILLLSALAYTLNNERGGDLDEDAMVSSSQSAARQSVTVILLVIMILLVPQFAVSVEASAPDAIYDNNFSTVDGCKEIGDWQPTWQPQYSSASITNAISLSCNGHHVDVFAASYSSALQGSELVSSVNHVLPDDWDPFVNRTTTAVRSNDSGVRKINETQAELPYARRVVWHWFQVDGKIATTSLQAKYYQLTALIRKKPAGGRVIVVHSSVDRDFDEVREKLLPVIQQLMAANSYTADDGS